MLSFEIKTHIDDKRSFEEYESSFTYQWIKNLDGIIDSPPEDYIATGTYDENNNIPIVIWGIPSNINNNHPRGFEITNIICDDRVMDSGELENTWLPSFINLVLSYLNDEFSDNNGNNLYDSTGCVAMEYKYDYVWCSSEKHHEIFKSDVNFTNKDGKVKYYIWKR